MKKRILTLGITLALVATMVMPMAALALDPNQSGQTAATFTGEIEIVGKDADTAVTQIWFPPAAPTFTVSNPWNDADDPTSPPAPPTDNQVLSVSTSEPVVRLKNTSLSLDFIVWLGISAWTAAVVSEDYELVDTTVVTVNEVNDVLSATGGAAMFPTGTTINAGTYKALYLEVVLGSTAGVTGTSTLTVLGSAP